MYVVVEEKTVTGSTEGAVDAPAVVGPAPAGLA
jgi:hypothetical protein